MKTRHLLGIFFGIKGLILLASVSFVILHYMATDADEKSAGIDALDNGFTKLMYAVQHNDLPGVQALIKQGADLDVQSTNIWTREPKFGVDGSTALYMAAANLDNSVAEKIVAELVNAGANVRIKNKAFGETAIHSAEFKSNTHDNRVPNLIALLVKNGADINAQTAADLNAVPSALVIVGETPLHYALENSRSDWVDALRGQRFGALVDETIKNSRGETAFDVAKRVRPDIWKTGLRKPVFKPGERDENGFTGLMLAVIRGDEDYVKRQFLVGGGVTKDVIDLRTSGDIYGYTALEEAILHQRPNMAKLLMERGANPDVKDLRGTSPLLLVCKLESPSDRTAVIDALAQRANLNIQNVRGDTLLHIAVRNNDATMIKYLLGKYMGRLLLTAVNGDKDTPGQLAKKLGYRDIQSLLGA